MDIYDKIELLKKDKGLKNKDLCVVTKVTSDAFRMAVKRRSLNEFQKDAIEQYFVNLYDSNTEREVEAVEIPLNYIKVPVIPIHAQAGFLSGYGDTAYWDGLPNEIWEVDKQYKGDYVVFEVKGDSMDDNSVNAILEGDRILCREIGRQHWQNKLHINKWNFVIVHREEGIIVKRITEHDVDKGVIKCHSLNSYYEDFEVNLNDVIALYNVVDLKRNLRL